MAAWGVEGWKFYKLLMNGLDTPFIFRLWETDRDMKVEAGVTEAMEKTSQELEAAAEKWRKEDTTMETIVRSPTTLLSERIIRNAL
jgi:hypothetical protein